MENEFPPNSHTKREVRTTRSVEKAEAPEKKEVAQIAKGKVTRRKKPLYRQFLDSFRPEDNRGFLEYTVLEVIVPGIKDNLADAATTAIEHALGVGGSRPSSRRRRGGGGGGYTSYNRMSSGRSRDPRDRDRDRDDRRSSRESVDHTEVVFDSRVEAEEILETMYEMMSKYDAVTRRDLLSMAGEPHSFTDEDWGWTDLRGARVHRVREGYLLDLPRPEALD